MAEGKKTFILYTNWQDAFDSLPDEKAGQLIKHIFAYVNDQNPQSDDFVINAVFGTMKGALKEDLKKWQSIVERNRVNGKKGGRPKKTDFQQYNKNPENPLGYLGNPKKPKKPDNDNDNDIYTPIIPSLDEFIDYARGALEKRGMVYSEYEQSIILKYDAWRENKWCTGTDPPRLIKRWKTTLLNTIPHLKKTEINGKYATNALAKSLRAARKNRIEN